MNEKINPNGLAIFNCLADRKGEVLAFAEIANLAGIEAKTGFLTSAKKIASDRKMLLEKVEGAVKVEIRTCTEYPNGLKIETSKQSFVDGYHLIDKE